MPDKKISITKKGIYDVKEKVDEEQKAKVLSIEPRTKVNYSPILFIAIALIVLIIIIIICAVVISGADPLVLGLFYNSLIALLIFVTYIIYKIAKRRKEKQSEEGMIGGLLESVLGEEAGESIGELIEQGIGKYMKKGTILYEIKVSLKWVVLGALLADSIISFIFVLLLTDDQIVIGCMGAIQIMSVICLILVYLIIYFKGAMMGGGLGGIIGKFGKSNQINPKTRVKVNASETKGNARTLFYTILIFLLWWGFLFGIFTGFGMAGNEISIESYGIIALGTLGIAIIPFALFVIPNIIEGYLDAKKSNKISFLRF